MYGLSMGIDRDLAGFSVEADGKIKKPIPSGNVLIPGEITLDSEDLIWRFYGSAEARPRNLRPAKEVLNDFARLWRQHDNEFLEFAQGNGVLWLNSERIPFSLSQEGREPLAVWRTTSRKVCAMLNIASALEAGRRIDPDEWKHVSLYDEGLLRLVSCPAGAMFALAREVNHLLHVGRVGFSLTPRLNRFELGTELGGFMLNAVFLQLALTLSQSDSLFVCSGCSMPYARSRERRRPRKGQGNFCDECGVGEARRQADVRRRHKKAEARKLAAEGVAVEQIAARLDTRVECVHRWVR
jgi:hypothetical protein